VPSNQPAAPDRLIVEADGGSRGNPGPAGYGAVVRDARTGAVLAERMESLGTTTNNVAEYSGLIAGLTAAAELAPGANVEVRMDSKLVVEQMTGRWQIKHPALRPLAAQASAAARRLGRVSYQWVPRARNTHADRLANQAMDGAAAAADAGGGGQRAGTDRSADGFSSPRAEGPSRAPRPGPSWTAAHTDPVTTLLLRHGETPLSAGRRFAGRGDIPLTETGQRQARAAAQRLAARGGIQLIVTSPLRRARATAEAVAAATGAPVRVDDGWLETDFGAWEGLSFAEAMQRWPDEIAAWLKDTSVAPPGGESFAAATRRVLPALDRLLARGTPGTVVVVSHVTPMKIVLRHALLAPPPALRRMHLDVACLCEVDWYADGPAVVRSLNDTAHLQPPVPPFSAYADEHGGRAGRAAAPRS
jgi:ribonuclease H / adenosylcobalamin/alpha-ribazole phosphatase